MWARTAALLLVAVAVAHATPLPQEVVGSDEEAWSLDLGSNAAAKEDPMSSLVQANADNYVPGYAGCKYGYFYCSKFQNAGISEADASLISAQPDASQPDEWFYNGKPTCVARGAHHQPCAGGHALVCAGDGLFSSSFGRAEVQADELKKAIDNGGVHPECPGCTVGRRMDRSPTVCLVAKGDVCVYECDEGYSNNGTRICGVDGAMQGGECYLTPVNTTITMYTNVEEVEKEEPTPPPKVWTQDEIAHENWTHWQEMQDIEMTAVYRERLAGQACLYLLDLEIYFNDVRHLLPNKILRRSLRDAARAARCAWLHEEVVADWAEIRHEVPPRGDKGPWPNVLHPNAVHVLVEGQGQVAVHTDITNGRGLDLYKALEQRLGIKSSQFTVYLPNSVHPVEEAAELSSYHLHPNDVLQLKMGRQLQQTSETKEAGSKRTWKKGAAMDTELGPIAP